MTLTGWLLVAVVMVLAMAAAWLATRIKTAWLRRSCYIVGVFLPLIAYAIIGLATNCLPIEAGERCYGIGLGWVVLSPFWASWTVAFLIALGYSRANRNASA